MYVLWQVALIYKSFDCRILFAVGRVLSVGVSMPISSLPEVVKLQI